MAFDGSNYLAVWMDMTNDANGNIVCDAGEGSCWDLYGQFISKSGLLLGSKITISTDPGNQLGGAGFANGRYLALVNNGVILGASGISQVSDASAVFITSASQFTATGTYTYTGGATGGPLTLTWTDSQFICSGPQLGVEIQTVSSLTATTMIWADTGNGGMTLTRVGTGVDGDINGTWITSDPGSSNTFTVTFAAGGLTVSGHIFQCGANGPPGITGFSPASGPIGSLVAINGNNFSPLASSNTVLFNGALATVTGVRSGQLFAVVPPGATSGFITVTNSNGTATTATPFTVTATPTGASLSGGGVHHRIDSAGSQFDALEAGINSYATSLFGMTLTVSGPSGFSYLPLPMPISSRISTAS